jgi:Cu-processing system permease protein
MFNPIDLSRILIILELDISVLLGYTGAVFQKFFGTSLGMIASFGLLFAWAGLPIAFIVRQAKRKDF